MVNSFGPGNQENPKRAANGVGAYNGKKKKKPTNTFNTPTGGTPAANPMGGAQMDFDMPDMSGMGGMQMNAPNPMGSGNTPAYQDWMQGLQSGGAPEPTMADIPPVRSPEGPTRAGDWRGDEILGMNSMGAQPTAQGLSLPAPNLPQPPPQVNYAQPTGVQSPQVAGWDDPAMGSFQMDTPMMDDPNMGVMEMGQPDMGEPFMGDPIMGFQQGPAGGGAGGRPGPPGDLGLPPQGNAPDGWQGDFPAHPILGPWAENQAEYERWMEEMIAGPRQRAWEQTNEGWDITRKLADKANEQTERDRRKKPSGRRPSIPGRGSRNSFAGGQAPAGGDALGDALSGGSQAGSSVAPAVSAAPPLPPDPRPQPDPPLPPAPDPDPPLPPDPYPLPPLPPDPPLPPAPDPPEPPPVSEVAPTAPPKASAYPAMVRDESGKMVIDPDYQSGKIKDYREMPVAPAVSRPPTGQPDWKGDDTPEPEIAGAKLYVPPSQGPAGALRSDGVMPEVSPEKRALIKQLEDEGAFTDGQGNVIPYHDDIGQHMEVLDKAMKSRDSGEDKPALEEFKDKVDAGEVSDEEPAASTEPVSEGAMMDERNWDTVDGEYKFMGADYHKQNTRPETDTKDWEETREEAAEDIKEGDKFSEVGDAAYGTAASESRSAANEAAEPFNPDDWMMGGLRSDPSSHMRNKVTDERITQDEYQRLMSGSSAGGTAPIVSLPPTQPPPVEEPSADADYYDKLVNPGKFQNPAISLPPTYGKGEGPGSQGLGGTFQPVGEYDAEIPELYDEYGNIHTGPNPIVVEEEEDEGALGIRRRAESPAQMRIRRNNLVADEYEKMNQGLGGMTSARPGMSSDIGSYAQQQLGPEVAARMAAGQVQLDVPFQYDMQHADQVRKRRQEKHAEGLAQAGMIRDDYYDHLNDLIKSGATNNEIMQWAAAQQAPAFG